MPQSGRKRCSGRCCCARPTGGGVSADRRQKLEQLALVRKRLGLMRKADLDEWAKQNGLDADELETLMDETARIDAASRLPPGAVDRHMLAILQAQRRLCRGGQACPAPSAISLKVGPIGRWPPCRSRLAAGCFSTGFSARGSGEPSRTTSINSSSGSDSPPARRSIAFWRRSTYTRKTEGEAGAAIRPLIARRVHDGHSLQALSAAELRREFRGSRRPCSFRRPPAASGRARRTQRMYTVYPVGKTRPYGIADPTGQERCVPAALERRHPAARRSRMRRAISTISCPARRSSRWRTSTGRCVSCSTCGRATSAGPSIGTSLRATTGWS